MGARGIDGGAAASACTKMTGASPECLSAAWAGASGLFAATAPFADAAIAPSADARFASVEGGD